MYIKKDRRDKRRGPYRSDHVARCILCFERHRNLVVYTNGKWIEVCNHCVESCVTKAWDQALSQLKDPNSAYSKKMTQTGIDTSNRRRPLGWSDEAWKKNQESLKQEPLKKGLQLVTP